VIEFVVNYFAVSFGKGYRNWAFSFKTKPCSVFESFMLQYYIQWWS